MEVIELYDKMYKLGLSPDEYYLLYFIAHKINRPYFGNKDTTLKKLRFKNFIDKRNQLTIDKSILEEYFEYINSGVDYDNQIKLFINLFPAERLPNGNMARQSFNEVKKKFQLFFLEYDYDWDTIFKATKKYIEYYKNKDYNYMRNCKYFILKDNNSDLALECDSIKSYKETNSKSTFQKDI